MRIQPQSTITLYKNVTIDSNEQIAFSSVENQRAYFESKIAASNVNCTVVRKTGSLRVDIGGGIVSKCNYLSFINPNFDNKIVYARIVDYEYINNECVEIYYVIDYWQTWMFDVSFEDMYIEREHLSEADFEKAEENPYDQSIYEFKTSENLPINENIEKPYYEIGNDDESDGIFLNEAAKNTYNLGPTIGALLVFSDFDFTAVPASAALSFCRTLEDLTYSRQGMSYYKRDTLSAFKLTSTVKEAMLSIDPNFTHVIDDLTGTSTGRKWTIGENESVPPFTSNRINAPVNYVYVDNPYDPVTGSTIEKILKFFTDNSGLSSVLGIYPVPQGFMLLSGLGVTSAPFRMRISKGNSERIENKKLDLFPYTYYRIISPNGDIKELRIEDFRAAQLGQDDCYIGLSLDIVEKPNLLIAPIDYKINGITPSNSDSNMNSLESMVFSQFPCLPYSISAWDAQMAAVANSIIGNNTVEYQNQLGLRSELLNDETIKSAASGEYNATMAGVKMANKNASGAIGNIGAGANSLRSLQLNEQYARPMLENEAAMSEAAYRVLEGTANESNNAVIDNFKYTKPAYAANMYHPINGDGVLNGNFNNFFDILFLKVSLHPTILAQYDQYFKYFGYASGRCGMPRIINYIHGNTNNTDTPHWTEIGGKLTTYIKTTDCKVVHAMLPVAQYIKAMFDSGVRMIKGDPS